VVVSRSNGSQGVNGRRFAAVFFAVLAVWLVHFAMQPYAWVGDFSIVVDRIGVGSGVFTPGRWLTRILAMGLLGLAAGLVVRRARRRWVLALALYCVGLELAQALVMYRHPRSGDLLLGFVAGCTGFLATARCDFCVAWLEHHFATLARATAVGLLLLLGSWILDGVRYSSLENWNSTFHLAIGNELTWDREWHGRIRGLAMYGHAVSERDALELTETALGSAIARRRTLGAVALYVFDGRATGTVEDLVGDLDLLIIDPARPEDGEGLVVGPHVRVRTERPARNLAEVLARDSAFSIELWFRTERNQFGPARIVTLSMNPFLRNFTIGQVGGALHVRVRSVGSGTNGADDATLWPDVLATTDWQHVVFTYADGRTSLVRNGHPEPPPELSSPTLDPAWYLVRNPLWPGLLFLLSIGTFVTIGWPRRRGFGNCQS
jgi:Concanavalin A-like lectin/glucanases superfamily